MLPAQSWLRKARRASACSSRASHLMRCIASSRCARRLPRCDAMADLLPPQMSGVPGSPAVRNVARAGSNSEHRLRSDRRQPTSAGSHADRLPAACKLLHLQLVDLIASVCHPRNPARLRRHCAEGGHWAARLGYGTRQLAAAQQLGSAVSPCKTLFTLPQQDALLVCRAVDVYVGERGALLHVGL
eukprot:scaffold56520_cov51-Phaeocystis_antarctica.AAC.4